MRKTREPLDDFFQAFRTTDLYALIIIK